MSVHDIFLSNTVKCLYTEIQTYVQERSTETMEKTKRIVQLGASEEDLKILTEEMNLLWRYLN